MRAASLTPALLGLMLLGLASAPAFAQPVQAPPVQPPPVTVTNAAALNITPKRLTFDRARRNGTVFILNQGTDPVTVDIGLIDRVMLPDGQILAADDAAKSPAGQAAAAGLQSAKDLLQVSPRRVTLAPGKAQTIRVRLSSMPEGAANELRTHLTITTLPPRDTGATAEEAAAGGGQNELRFRIAAVYGLSIPVIVRPSDADVKATIQGAHTEFVDISPDGRAAPKRTAVVAFDIARAGASSVYGNLEVRVVGERKGADALGVARGVAVYPEISRRSVRIPLSRPPATGETLEVTFTDDDTSPGKVLAKADF